MPLLPSLNIINQEHYDRIVAAFPGPTDVAKAASYRAWLSNHLVNYVLHTELRAIEHELETERASRIAAVYASLPPLQEVPTGEAQPVA